MAGPGVILGDSTVAAYLGGVALADLLGPEVAATDLSVPGDRIADQLGHWTAALPLSPGWVMIQIGLNDLVPGQDAENLIAELQALVVRVRHDVAEGTPILLSAMIPCRSRLTDLYGTAGGDRAQGLWQALNDAIAGRGHWPISGVDARIAGHVAAMDDGCGNLLPAYDTGDGIHPNTAGRRINAAAWQSALDPVIGNISGRKR